jgi:hypothetical protein
VIEEVSEVDRVTVPLPDFVSDREEDTVLVRVHDSAALADNEGVALLVADCSFV